MKYFMNLKINDLEILATNIFNKFMENKNKIVNKFLKNLLKIKENCYLVILKKYLSKWYDKIEINSNLLSSNNKREKMNNSNNILLNRKSNSVKFLSRLNNYNLKSQRIKNKIILENYNLDELQCTFNTNLDLTKKIIKK